MTKVLYQKQLVLFLGFKEFVDLTIRVTDKNDLQTSELELITMILLGPTHYIVFLIFVNIPMGRTIPSFRIAAVLEEEKWKLFRKYLRNKNEKKYDCQYGDSSSSVEELNEHNHKAYY